MRVSKKARFGPRERQVLDILLRGLGEKEVAHVLGISPNTVHSYVTNVYRYFAVDSRAALMSLWINDAPPAALGAQRTCLDDDGVLTPNAAMVGC